LLPFALALYFYSIYYKLMLNMPQKYNIRDSIGMPDLTKKQYLAEKDTWRE
jgi:hypothetical protein